MTKSISPSARTEVAPPVTGRSQRVWGRPEQLMRVRHYSELATGAFGVRTGMMTTGPWVRDLDGRPTDAAVAVMVDNVLASSMYDAEPQIRGLATTELHLNVLRPIPTDGTELQAWTRLGTVDALGGMATANLLDAEGNEYVQASGWFQRVEQGATEALTAFEANAQLPLGLGAEAGLGSILGVDEATRAPTMSRRPEVTAHFQEGLGFLRRDELHNSKGSVHGGVLATMVALAAQQAMPNRLDFDLQSLRVVFIRPATGPLSARTRVYHAGRTLCVIEVELLGATGKPLVHGETVFRGAR